jgi:hypothetical protein
MTRTAQCLCGALTAIVAAEPMMVNVCHCEDCQRRSGVPWSSAAYFPTESVSLKGPNKIYLRTSDSGTRINHHFCPTCGVTVCWTRESGGVVACHGRCGALGHTTGSPTAASLRLSPADRTRDDQPMRSSAAFE